MKEKRTIEYLAPYLPYGLNMVGCQSKLNPAILQRFLDDEFDIIPILYDLSYLTKEIEVNGEKFVPMVELWKYHWNKDEIGEYKTGFNKNSVYIRHDVRALHIDLSPISHIRYWIIQKLLEWHFAINIPKHLYINKNAL